ncbi:uncharacterized protein LOC130846020 [Hippopotamus amphibius kiboko]|uniref:uncharacterized protein LOC130846020 n=1 Tax=Hippopotamus amphibius kiboko TaxID=575201 RepID=UPI0025970AFE|nr:uncharacterized protein LOC130846020 [Hippopotamus amphibius kiboko]
MRNTEDSLSDKIALTLEGEGPAEQTLEGHEAERHLIPRGRIFQAERIAVEGPDPAHGPEMTRDLASKKDECLPGADSPLSCDCPAKREAASIRTGAPPAKVPCAGGRLLKAISSVLAHGPGSSPGPFLLLLNICCDLPGSEVLNASLSSSGSSWQPSPLACFLRQRSLHPGIPAGARSHRSPPFLPTPASAQPECFLPPSLAVIEKLSGSV